MKISRYQTQLVQIGKNQKVPQFGVDDTHQAKESRVYGVETPCIRGLLGGVYIFSDLWIYDEVYVHFEYMGIHMFILRIYKFILTCALALRLFGAKQSLCVWISMFIPTYFKIQLYVRVVFSEYTMNSPLYIPGCTRNKRSPYWIHVLYSFVCIYGWTYRGDRVSKRKYHLKILLEFQDKLTCECFSRVAHESMREISRCEISISRLRHHVGGFFEGFWVATPSDLCKYAWIHTWACVCIYMIYMYARMYVYICIF